MKTNPLLYKIFFSIAFFFSPLLGGEFQIWNKIFEDTANKKLLYKPNVESELHFSGPFSRIDYVHVNYSLGLRVKKYIYVGPEYRWIRSIPTKTNPYRFEQDWVAARIEGYFPCDPLELNSRLKFTYHLPFSYYKGYFGVHLKNKISFMCLRRIILFVANELFLNVNRTQVIDRVECSTGIDFKIYKEKLFFSMYYLHQSNRTCQATSNLKTPWNFIHALGLSLKMNF